MTNRYRAVFLCLFTLGLCCLAQTTKPTPKTSSTTGAPDKAYMQKIWDGWGTLEPANLANFYASGPPHPILRARRGIRLGHPC